MANSFSSSDNSAKAKNYLHIPIRLFAYCDDSDEFFDHVLIASLFSLSSALEKSESKKLGTRQLRKAFHPDYAQIPDWCDPENDQHFYFYRAAKINGLLDVSDFDFDEHYDAYLKYSYRSRIATVHQKIYCRFANDRRKNAELDFRILCAIKAVLGRDRPFQCIPSIWLRYGYFGVTAKEREFMSRLPTKKRIIDSIRRLEKQDLITKVTDANRSYFSTRLDREQLIWHVARKSVEKDLQLRRAKEKQKLAELKAAFRSEANNGLAESTT